MSDDEKQLLRDAIPAWRKGDPLPELLINFPPFERKPYHRCGLMLSGEMVSHYVYDIRDPDFLRALVLEPQTCDETLRAALRQSLRTQGIAWTATLIAEATAEDPVLVRRQAVADLCADLRSPCVRLQVACFEKHRPVPLAHAWDVLRQLQINLQSGMSWRDAHRTAFDAMLVATFHRPSDEVTGGSHLMYACDAVATPGYVDLMHRRDLRTGQFVSIPPGHLEVVFTAKGGTHLIDVEDAIWLYHADEYFGGIA